MRTHLVLLVGLVLSPSALLAQSVVPLSGTWRLGGITPETFSGTCPAAAPVTAVSEEGTVTFQPGGTWTVSSTGLEVCSGGVCTTTSDSGGGTYHVRADGVVIFDDDPAVPGADIGFAMMRSDASVLFFARDNEESDEPELGVVVALSSGHGSASLQGEYGFVRLLLRNDASAQSLRGDEGTLTFDGSGGFSETSVRHTVVWNGSATTGTSYSGPGTYTVAADGTVTIGGGRGAVSPDREFVFWMRQACPEIELTIAVRKPLPSSSGFVAGDWGVGSVEADVSRSALESDWGTITLMPQGPNGGSLAPSLLRVSTIVTPGGTTTSPQQVLADAYTLGQAGRLTLFSQGAQRAPVPGWVSRDGSVFVGAPWLATPPASSAGVGLVLGLARCSFPAQVGAATPGSGAISPLLLSIGGFPYVGNGAFGFVVAAGRGGVPGALLLSRAPLASGFPFLGVAVWVDPTQLLVTVPLALSGPLNAPGVGAAGWSLSLAQQPPSLAGARLTGQAVLVDAGAPSMKGLSATAAIDVTVCR